MPCRQDQGHGQKSNAGVSGHPGRVLLDDTELTSQWAIEESMEGKQNLGQFDWSGKVKAAGGITEVITELAEDEPSV